MLFIHAISAASLQNARICCADGLSTTGASVFDFNVPLKVNEGNEELDREEANSRNIVVAVDVAGWQFRASEWGNDTVQISD